MKHMPKISLLIAHITAKIPEKAKTVLGVGCGDGWTEFNLHRVGFEVYATDLKRAPEFLEEEGLKFYQSDIFDLRSFPIEGADVVICNQVLEHLPDYKTAFANLIKLTRMRLIVAFPWRRSYMDPDHCNFWDDFGDHPYLDVREFFELGEPHVMELHRQIDKPSDVERNQSSYLLTVDV